MKKSMTSVAIIFCFSSTLLMAQVDPPASFDLRDVDGNCYVTPVKSKTCSS